MTGSQPEQRWLERLRSAWLMNDGKPRGLSRLAMRSAFGADARTAFSHLNCGQSPQTELVPAMCSKS